MFCIYRTALHNAAERGFLEIATDILNHGADINAQNWNKITPLHLAAKYGRFDMVEMLVERDAYMDAQDDQGNTPLHLAAMNGYGDICKFLISSGCDHTIPNNEQMKAPEVAQEPLKKDLIDFIINGLMSRARGSIELSQSNMGICVFCQSQDAEFVFNPCHHVSLCPKCYDENKDRLHFCPMCRKTLKSVETIKRD